MRFDDRPGLGRRSRARGDTKTAADPLGSRPKLGVDNLVEHIRADHGQRAPGARSPRRAAGRSQPGQHCPGVKDPLPDRYSRVDAAHDVLHRGVAGDRPALFPGHLGRPAVHSGSRRRRASSSISSCRSGASAGVPVSDRGRHVSASRSLHDRRPASGTASTRERSPRPARESGVAVL